MQAYIVELESLVTHLEEENDRLLKEQVLTNYLLVVRLMLTFGAIFILFLGIILGITALEKEEKM